MKRTRTALFSLIALLLSSAFTTGFRSPARPVGETHPLIGESLTALTGLVAKENCVVHDAADDDVENGTELPFVLCDDGLPPSGGGEAGIPVPAKYAFDANGNDWRGLPEPATDEETAEADASDDLQPEDGNRITLDIDVTLPPSARVAREMELDIPTVKRPKKGFPVIVLMHGCCGGSKTSWEAPTIDTEREHWHHSNVWWASTGVRRGHVHGAWVPQLQRPGLDRHDSIGFETLRDQRLPIPRRAARGPRLERRVAGEKPAVRYQPETCRRGRWLVRRGLLVARADRPVMEESGVQPVDQTRGGGAQVRVDGPRRSARSQRPLPGHRDGRRARNHHRARPSRRMLRHAIPSAS